MVKRFIAILLGAILFAPHVECQTTKMHEAQADFALRLLREESSSSKDAIDEGGESTVISPASITIALSMVLAGADGQTQQQMLAVMANGMNSSEFGKYMKVLLSEIITVGEEGENGTAEIANGGQNYTLRIANRLYIHESFTVKPTFLQLIQRYYGAAARQANFGQKDAVIQEINSWVERETDGKIAELLNAGNLNEDTVMMLLNAVYFNGKWRTKFDRAKTAQKQFHLTVNHSKEVSMMSVKENFPYFENDNLQLLGLPYHGSTMHMFLLLPKTRFGLSQILNDLQGKDLLDYIKNCYPRDIEVELPQFKLEKKLDLVETLKKLGMKDLFSGQAANLPHISDSALTLSDVLHKAFIEVNEEGTEAAAATAIGAVWRMIGEPPPPVRFIADQPFLFAVIKDLKDILFIGRMAH